MQRNRESFKDRYNRKNAVHSDCIRRKTAGFIGNHLNSTVINITRTEEDIDAVLIFTDSEGADEVILYVNKSADFTIHDYFT